MGASDYFPSIPSLDDVIGKPDPEYGYVYDPGDAAADIRAGLTETEKNAKETLDKLNPWHWPEQVGTYVGNVAPPLLVLAGGSVFVAGSATIVMTGLLGLAIIDGLAGGKNVGKVIDAMDPSHTVKSAGKIFGVR